MIDKLRVAVLAQDDSFVIPRNIRLLGDIEQVELVAVAKIDANAKGSMVSKKMLFFQGFGVTQTAKMALLSSINTIANIFDSMCLYKLGLMKSLPAAASSCGSEYKILLDPNSPESIGWLKNLNLDLVVSFSAPCVFKAELLQLPKYGCINLHCSLLPAYAGLLPSFWTLHEKAEQLGATVHKMDDKIDNGAILGQVEVSIPPNPSMFSVIKATKWAGGLLMVSVVKEILNGTSMERPNGIEPSNYYTWPTVQQIKAFRLGGGKLI
tara:strand:- start:19 stop:816 length:798 start_codon:yes stop_codon:yes gene_type:complete